MGNEMKYKTHMKEAEESKEGIAKLRVIEEVKFRNLYHKNHSVGYSQGRKGNEQQ